MSIDSPRLDSGELEQPPWHRQVRAFTLRGLRRVGHNRSALFWTVAGPSLYYLFFGVFTASSQFAQSATAVAFAIFGSLSATAFVFAGNLGADLRAKRYRKLRSLPVSPWTDLAGRFLSGLVVGVLAFCAVLLVALATGARFTLDGPLAALTVLVSILLICLVGTSLSIIAAGFVQDSQRINVLGNALVAGLFFVTGFNGIQPSILPSVARGVVNVAPNSLATRLILGVLTPAANETGSSLTPPPVPGGLLSVSALLAYVVVLVPLSVLVMQRIVYWGEAGE
ncbi:ABC transporter permease [Halobacterium zhouii]|uniref:ABC transporter permease n=1 Tax=Halobacterium zhouii TaxID=2902624 RepID=UPI001E509759|nr:ABC transporter permease [Halobacterium zhouii]